MFAQVHFPQLLRPSELDQYLSMGWFRMGQTIFTTNFLNFKNEFYSAIWLRLQLKDFAPDKKQLRIKKNNSAFRVEINPATVTPEKEELFARYRASVTFEASASLDQLLFGKTKRNIFNTFEVDVYNGGRLIAIGYFDVGGESAAGISSFYDPDYKKFSLGKFLILSKIEFCQHNNLRYFYPGYFVPGYPAFDYKLQLSGAGVEYFQVHANEWKSIEMISPSSIPINEMKAKLKAVHELFMQAGITNKVYKYEFFDANLIPDLSGLELFDYPIFLAYNFSSPDLFTPIVVYDVCGKKYHLIACRSMWPSKLQHDLEDVFCAHLLKIEEYLFSSPDPNSIVAHLQSGLQFQAK